MRSTLNESMPYENTIAKLFILCFPFKMFAPLSSLGSITFGLGDAASFLFCALGLLCILSRGKFYFTKDQGTKLLSNFAMMYLICDITSLLMSGVLYSRAGVIAGETTFVAASKKIMYSFAFICFVYYCREIARILTKNEISNVINVCLNICIVIGFIQVFMISGVGVFGRIYDGLNLLFDAWSSDNAVRTQRIALLANEPAYSAGFITSIAIPYLLSQMMEQGIKLKYIFKAFLFLVLLYYTKSTTGYLLFFVDVGIFSVIYFTNSGKSTRDKFFSGLAFMISFLVVVFITITNTLISDTVFGVLDKFFSYDNPTSGDRKGMMAVGFELLKRYPIFGVGNGNQGFFYQELLPQWAYNTYTGISSYNRASTVLYDGGPFFIAFLSGYGIVGTIMLIGILVKGFRVMRDNWSAFGYLYYFYFMSIIALIINGLGATLNSRYDFWFVLSIPMMISYWSYSEEI